MLQRQTFNPFEMFNLRDYKTLWELSRFKHKAICTVFDHVQDCLPLKVPEVWACGDVAKSHTFSNCRGGIYFEDILKGLVDKTSQECIEYSYIIFKLDGRTVVCFCNTNPARTDKTLIVSIDNRRKRGYLIGLGLLIGLIAFFK